MSSDLFGYICPADRTREQEAAHEAAMSRAVHFSLPPVQFAKGDRVRLFDFYAAPEVVADVGFKFTRIHQITGSCVWAGGTNAVFASIAAQRLASDNPIQAFLPFTLHNYARSRAAIGWTQKGDGSVGSTFADSLREDGLIRWEPGRLGMPSFNQNDGISVDSKQVELDWSTVRNPAVSPILAEAKPHTFGSVTPARDVQAIRSLVANGYGVTFASNLYIGSARVQGSGDGKCVIGRWDSRGGHQQSILGVWEHPDFGPLYWGQNNWPGGYYPPDPAGGPLCGCWVPEDNVVQTLRSQDAEVFGLSALNWFPAQPKVFSWSQI